MIPKDSSGIWSSFLIFSVFIRGSFRKFLLENSRKNLSKIGQMVHYNFPSSVSSVVISQISQVVSHENYSRDRFKIFPEIPPGIPTDISAKISPGDCSVICFWNCLRHSSRYFSQDFSRECPGAPCGVPHVDFLGFILGIPLGAQKLPLEFFQMLFLSFPKIFFLRFSTSLFQGFLLLLFREFVLGLLQIFLLPSNSNRDY